nr:protein altered xyloglucan 4-like [Tanacetum cinerariifolium]
MGECRLFEGEWVRKPYEESSLLAYTNKSCPTMPDWKNCFTHGRVDTDFLNWRWKPNDCELSRFDPCKFLRIVRGKRMGFIGDSVSRNHVDSLICLLSKEESPINIYNDSDDRFPAWHFPNHDFTLLALWSKFLVAEDELIVNGSNSGMFNLNLDKVDHSWARQLPTLDYAIISDGHWFIRPNHLYQNNIKIGCVYCNEPNITNFNTTFAMRMSFRTALRYINECTKCKPITTILRTLSPSHFENGLWNTGGNCNRTKPLKYLEVGASEFNREISAMQNEEIERAKRECLGMKKKFKVMDITMAMAMRADGHPGSHFGNKWNKDVNDCVHWCLPGPIDVWSDFLMAILIN